MLQFCLQQCYEGEKEGEEEAKLKYADGCEFILSCVAYYINT